MITEVITITPDMTVDKALSTLRQYNIRSAPVIDSDKKFVGEFSFSIVIKNLLPISVTMDEGLDNLDFVVGTSPGVAKRLAKLKHQSVDSIMLKKTVSAYLDTPTWEAIRLMVKHGSPLTVIDEKSGELLGLITEQAALNDLEQIFANIQQDKHENDPDKEE